ncbi:hypothetical protein R3W88_029891 [Solanum pinnatisectum]|uniref:TMV resistance protein N-like n=1 Tax=Solanum pinnatisectum TaxID=50273 RepID=A0AAV9K721_9SOLN|nr:hypothetical protein R3W88_029891 [Solanum pinnatisectum]
MVDCKEKENGQTVIPIFYDVDPSYVRNQSESFAIAFAEHELTYKDDIDEMQMVQECRTSLTAAANLKGYDIRDEIESEKIQQIVDYIFSKFCKSTHSLSFLQDVLIVLDDIDHCDHLEYLAGDLCWFDNGSRVIVTTRNRHLIEKDNAIYQVPTLPDNEAMQLFNQHAFKKEIPDVHFKKFSLEVVNHAKGLPLALKVWGSLLHKKGLTQWRRTADQIKKNSNSEIVEKLKISFDVLEPEEKELFLDIAFMRIVESCDFGAEYGLNVLTDKSLVFISKHDTIEMHDLIEDMGKYIVKMHKHPGERSRLWDVEDFEKVMVDNTVSSLNNNSTHIPKTYIYIYIYIYIYRYVMLTHDLFIGEHDSGSNLV